MPFPEGFVYADLNVQFVRLTEPRTYEISVVAYPDPTPDEYTIGAAYDNSSVALSVPLSGNRIATFTQTEWVNGVSPGSTGSGPLDGEYTIETRITSGLSVLGGYSLPYPLTGLPQNPYSVYDWPGASPSYAIQVAAAGDYVVLGAALFGLASSGSDPRYYGAQWLVLYDCTGNTPVVVDQYLREATAAPGDGYPSMANVPIMLAPLSDTRVVVYMLSPDATSANPDTYGTIFTINVSGGTLAFEDNGYPLTTGATDFSQSFDQFFGYGEHGLFSSADEYAFGFTASAGNISFGSTVNSWDFEGYTYYMWSIMGTFVPSTLEPGVFYGPVYRLPDDYSGNPMHTAKFRYTGSGAVEMIDVSPALPGSQFSWQYLWSHSPGSGWRCIEHNGKVVTAVPAFYYDAPASLEDLWLVDDTFGQPEFYRVANLANVGAEEAGADYDITLISQGGYLYMAANIAEAFNSEVVTPADTTGFASAVVMAIVNFNQPDIAGELSERRRKFWRPRPGW